MLIAETSLRPIQSARMLSQNCKASRTAMTSASEMSITSRNIDIKQEVTYGNEQTTENPGGRNKHSNNGTNRCNIKQEVTYENKSTIGNPYGSHAPSITNTRHHVQQETDIKEEVNTCENEPTTGDPDVRHVASVTNRFDIKQETDIKHEVIYEDELTTDNPEGRNVPSNNITNRSDIKLETDIKQEITCVDVWPTDNPDVWNAASITKRHDIKQETDSKQEVTRVEEWPTDNPEGRKAPSFTNKRDDKQEAMYENESTTDNPDVTSRKIQSISITNSRDIKQETKIKQEITCVDEWPTDNPDGRNAASITKRHIKRETDIKQEVMYEDELTTDNPVDRGTASVTNGRDIKQETYLLLQELRANQTQAYEENHVADSENSIDEILIIKTMSSQPSLLITGKKDDIDIGIESAHEDKKDVPPSASNSEDFKDEEQNTSYTDELEVIPAKKCYTCAVCDDQFSLKKDLGIPIIRQNGVKTFMCHLCSKDNGKHSSHTTHPSPFSSKFCGIAFQQKTVLWEHMSMHMATSSQNGVTIRGRRKKRWTLNVRRCVPYPCNICHKMYKSKKHHDRHFKRVHSGKTKHECEDCGERFRTLPNLKRHMRTQHNYVKNSVPKTKKKNPFQLCNIRDEKHGKYSGTECVHRADRPHLCSICGKGFSKSSHLKAHMIVHIMISRGDVQCKETTCEICGKGFKTREHLRQHMICHGNSKRFQCEICGKAFNRKLTLKVHMCTHTDAGQEKRFTCDECGKKFQARQLLLAHKRAHEGRKLFYCDLCAKGYNNKLSMIIHLKRHIGIKAKWPPCGNKKTDKW